MYAQYQEHCQPHYSNSKLHPNQQHRHNNYHGNLGKHELHRIFPQLQYSRKPLFKKRMSNYYSFRKINNMQTVIPSAWTPNTIAVSAHHQNSHIYIVALYSAPKKKGGNGQGDYSNNQANFKSQQRRQNNNCGRFQQISRRSTEISKTMQSHFMLTCNRKYVTHAANRRDRRIENELD